MIPGCLLYIYINTYTHTHTHTHTRTEADKNVYTRRQGAKDRARDRDGKRHELTSGARTVSAGTNLACEERAHKHTLTLGDEKTDRDILSSAPAFGCLGMGRVCGAKKLNFWLQPLLILVGVGCLFRLTLLVDRCSTFARRSAPPVHDTDALVCRKEEIQNTEYLIGRREGGREDQFAFLVPRTGRDPHCKKEGCKLAKITSTGGTIQNVRHRRLKIPQTDKQEKNKT